MYNFKQTHAKSNQVTIKKSSMYPYLSIISSVSYNLSENHKKYKF